MTVGQCVILNPEDPELYGEGVGVSYVSKEALLAFLERSRKRKASVLKRDIIEFINANNRP